MSLPILILFTFILNILFSMTSSIVSTNKEVEDDAYKYQATLKWLSLCMEVFGTLMSVIYLQSLKQNFVPVVDDRQIFIGIVTRQSIIQYLMNNADKYM